MVLQGVTGTYTVQTVQTVQRNHLVWLASQAWQQVLERPWDAQAQTILRHWQAAQLPLVVATVRTGQDRGMLNLGLPAPQQWERRKLSLELPAAQVERTAPFPDLAATGPALLAAPGLLPFLEQMDELGVSVQVYGSWGWQQIAGMTWVRPGSDLDLRVCVSDHATAGAVAHSLAALNTPMRLDGELVFAGGNAVAWREYRQWTSGHTDRVLVKSISGVQLLDPLCLA